MAVQSLTLEGIPNGTAIDSGDAAVINADSMNIVAATLSIDSAQRPTSFTRSLKVVATGSGTGYAQKDVQSAAGLQEIMFMTPTTVNSEFSIMFGAVNGVRSYSVSRTGLGYIRLYNSAGATIWNSSSTYRTDGQWYRVAILFDVETGAGGPNTGTMQVRVYLDGSSTAAETSALFTAQDVGDVPINQMRWGRASTSGYVGTLYFANMRWDETGTAFISPAVVSSTVNAGADLTVEPNQNFTLSATSSGGNAVWSQVSGPTITLAGSGQVRTGRAPALLAGGTATFRATSGGVTDDMVLTIRPATDALIANGVATGASIHFKGI